MSEQLAVYLVLKYHMYLPIFLITAHLVSSHTSPDTFINKYKQADHQEVFWPFLMPLPSSLGPELGQWPTPDVSTVKAVFSW